MIKERIKEILNPRSRNYPVINIMGVSGAGKTFYTAMTVLHAVCLGCIVGEDVFMGTPYRIIGRVGANTVRLDEIINSLDDEEVERLIRLSDADLIENLFVTPVSEGKGYKEGTLRNPAILPFSFYIPPFGSITALLVDIAGYDCYCLGAYINERLRRSNPCLENTEGKRALLLKRVYELLTKIVKASDGFIYIPYVRSYMLREGGIDKDKERDILWIEGSLMSNVLKYARDKGKHVTILINKYDIMKDSYAKKPPSRILYEIIFGKGKEPRLANAQEIRDLLIDLHKKRKLLIGSIKPRLPVKELEKRIMKGDVPNEPPGNYLPTFLVNYLFTQKPYYIARGVE